MLVYKFLHPSGETRRLGTEQRGAFRRVPVVRALSELLDQRKSYVQKQLAGKGRACSNAEFRKLPIVTEDAVDFTAYCPTASLKKAKDRLEAAAGIQPLEGSAADRNQVQRATDFNDYQSDRFRSNFRYRVTQTCKMSMAELSYLLGVSMPTTFSKHYCDYTNGFTQLLLCKKLERWSNLHRKSADCEAVENDLKPDIQTLRLQNKRYGSRLCVELDVVDRPDSETEPGQFLLQIEDGCGVDAELYRITVKGDSNAAD